MGLSKSTPLFDCYHMPKLPRYHTPLYPLHFLCFSLFLLLNYLYSIRKRKKGKRIKLHGAKKKKTSKSRSCCQSQPWITKQESYWRVSGNENCRNRSTKYAKSMRVSVSSVPARWRGDYLFKLWLLAYLEGKEESRSILYRVTLDRGTISFLHHIEILIPSDNILLLSYLVYSVDSENDLEKGLIIVCLQAIKN